MQEVLSSIPQHQASQPTNQKLALPSMVLDCDPSFQYWEERAKMTEFEASLSYIASLCLKKLKLRKSLYALKALGQGKKEPRGRDAM